MKLTHKRGDIIPPLLANKNRTMIKFDNKKNKFVSLVGAKP